MGVLSLVRGGCEETGRAGPGVQGGDLLPNPQASLITQEAWASAAGPPHKLP